MRPYIVCHMMQSVDGRIACDMVDKISGDEYYDALDALDCPSRVEGRYSYQLHCCGFKEFKPTAAGRVGKERRFTKPLTRKGIRFRQTAAAYCCGTMPTTPTACAW